MNNIEKQIFDYICNVYRNQCATQTDIAKLLGVSQSHVCRIMSGKSNVGALSIKVIDRLFPNATLNIDGAPTVSGVGNLVESHNTDIAIHASSSSDKMSAIKNAILDSETLNPESKIEVLKIIKGIE